MKKISELFTVKYGVNLELNALKICSEDYKYAVNFVSRTSKNNGVSATVERIADVEPLPAGTISVACGGSVLETFLQPKPYYSGRDLFYLSPLTTMSDEVKLYYCACIKANKYKYNYGRQANKTLKDILIPDISDLPNFVTHAQLPDYSSITKPLVQDVCSLNVLSWKEFRYDDVFNIKRGESAYLQDMERGRYPYLSAASNNNGISGYVNRYNANENIIALNYDGSIGDAFFHDCKTFVSEKVVSLTLKEFALNKYIAFFLITLIRMEKFRFNYGLKWSVNSRMQSSKIKLPTQPSGKPDFEYMERFIKSLQYSAAI